MLPKTHRITYLPPSYPRFFVGILNILPLPALYYSIDILIRNVVPTIQPRLVLWRNIHCGPLASKALEITFFLFLVLRVAAVAFGGGVVGCELETFGLYRCGQLISRIRVSCYFMTWIFGISG